MIGGGNCLITNSPAHLETTVRIHPEGIMKQEKTRLCIRLPRQRFEFAKAYASARGMTVEELIDRYLCAMQSLEKRSVTPEVDVIAGLVPGNVEAEPEYRELVTSRD